MLKQSNFFKTLELKTQISHGGELARGKRKTRRPLDRKKPLHIVMRSTRARGDLSFLRHNLLVKRIIHKQSQKFGVKIHAFANVGNHIHLMLRFTNRFYFQNFLRSVTAMIARALTKARKGKIFGKFWDALAFSRVLTSNKERAALIKYVEANKIEATLGKNARKEFLKKRKNWELKLYSS